MTHQRRKNFGREMPEPPARVLSAAEAAALRPRLDPIEPPDLWCDVVALWCSHEGLRAERDGWRAWAESLGKALSATEADLEAARAARDRWEV